MAILVNTLKSKFDIHVVKHIDLEDLSIDMTGPDHWSTIVSSNRLVARLARIPGFKWPVQKVQLRIIIQEEGKDVGKLESPFTPASVVDGASVTSSISPCTMTIFPTAHSVFADFVSQLATKPDHTFSVKGSADIVINLGLLGIHTINGVDFISDLTLRGLNSLPDLKCTEITEVVRSLASEVTVKALFTINNPSQLALTLGDLQLAVWSPASEDESDRPEQFLGTVKLVDLKLVQGVNEGKVAVMVLDTTLEATQNFLKATEARTVVLKGFGSTSENVAINAGLNKLRTTVSVPVFSVPDA
ncbi:hypothetical protein EC957_007933 [Mortierella hygrophila]|uniref:Uncharacterized protein n=1 Tax=Mortierella hygrophila TaxID=979708 RepID=A0A9P6JXT6_9FUNG|nr:hypothetical protein EC957_007933 [Mortierella hygrophila]